VIDSVDAWRKATRGNPIARLDVGGIRDAVNAVSSITI
jgi:hypothetical protein